MPKLTAMIIGEIGNSFGSTRKIRYLSDESLLEYDAIIIDFESIVGNIDIHNPQKYLRRKKNFEEFVLHKKMPLIYFTPVKPDSFQMVNNMMLSNVSFDFFAPVPSFKIENEKGSLVNVITKTPFSDFFTKYKGNISYYSYLTSSVGNRILETQHTKKTLGFYDENCVFIPGFRTSDGFNESEFLSDLINSTKNSLKSSSRPEFPEWAKRFLLPDEASLKSAMHTLSTEIVRLQNELQTKEIEYSEYINLKRLFTGTGNELEEEVGNIFKQLGFEVLESEPGRDDLILRYSDKIMVVEIKGINKSAAESHAAQLEKWSMNYFLKHDVKPKPVLIINAWKDTPLDKRTEQAFPDQMMNFSVPRDHCLLTTIQLLGIFNKAMKDPSSKELLIETVFTTVGRFDGFDDWKTIVSIQP